GSGGNREHSIQDHLAALNVVLMERLRRIRIDEPINKPNSGTVNFWDEWQKPVKDKRLLIAVDNWRKQNIQ
ncbi:hypothetical protein V2J93_26265, partial [Pseudomonas alliivorans]|nr:hypothetical protein [Pseudomonas alliivorans]